MTSRGSQSKRHHRGWEYWGPNIWGEEALARVLLI